MNKVFAILLGVFVLGCSQLYGQYRIKEVDEEDLREGPSGVLGPRELLVQCKVSPDYRIQYSVDKRNWISRKMSYKRIIEVKLDEEYAYFFVRICDDDGSAVNCRDIKLSPGKRYALVWDPEKNIAKLVTTKL